MISLNRFVLKIDLFIKFDPTHLSKNGPMRLFIIILKKNNLRIILKNHWIYFSSNYS